MNAADAMRLLAAAAIPLHVLPFGGVLFSILGVKLACLGLFLIWALGQVVLHLALIRAADELLEKTRRNLIIALCAGTLLALLAIGGQALVAGMIGSGIVVILVIGCGMFDLLTAASLLYVYMACFRLIGSFPYQANDRHAGFEVVVPEARTLDERAA